MEMMYYVELDVGGLKFITNQQPNNELVAEFLKAYVPSHVYTDVEVVNGCVICTIMNSEYRTKVYWTYKQAILFNKF